MKICRKCHERKEIEDFYTSDKSNCKECIKARVRENHNKVGDSYDKTYKGVVRVMYKTMKRNQRLRGHGEIPFSKEEFLTWLEKNNFETLYQKYIDSGYHKDVKPSVDRLCDFSGYSFGNMRLVTWRDNKDHQTTDILQGTGTSGKRCHPIGKYDQEGNLIKKYTSFQEVRRLEGYCVQYPCKGNYPCKNGFIWKKL